MNYSYQLNGILNDLNELKRILEARAQLDLLNDLYIHEMITEETYKLALEDLVSILQMNIKFLK